MGRAAALALQCPVNSRHARFNGSQRACFDVPVALDATGAVLHRGAGSLSYFVSTPRDNEIGCAVCGACVQRPRSPVTFVPAEGMMLLCDFSAGFKPPQMVKVRPVVVLSQRVRNRQTCIVVPCSSAAPQNTKVVSVILYQSKYSFLDCNSFAKCEMAATVSNGRLFLFRDRVTGRGRDSRLTTVDAGDLANIRRGTARAIGLTLTR
jgi:uncharacterized protein YifN (PemK superfamily)